MNLRFMGDWNPWVGASVALALAVLAWFLYRRETRTNACGAYLTRRSAK